MRRLLLLLPLALPLVACGGGQVVAAKPQTVVGTVPTVQATTTNASTVTSPSNSGGQSSGEAVFTGNGCSGCHTYKPAGSTAQVGPDLDKLAEYAKQAKQPLTAFVHESIVNPSAYIQPGYQDLMPKNYKSTIPKPQLDALVKFLTSGK